MGRAEADPLIDELWNSATAPARRNEARCRDHPNRFLGHLAKLSAEHLDRRRNGLSSGVHNKAEIDGVIEAWRWMARGRLLGYSNRLVQREVINRQPKQTSARLWRCDGTSKDNAKRIRGGPGKRGGEGPERICRRDRGDHGGVERLGAGGDPESAAHVRFGPGASQLEGRGEQREGPSGARRGADLDPADGVGKGYHAGRLKHLGDRSSGQDGGRQGRARCEARSAGSRGDIDDDRHRVRSEYPTSRASWRKGRGRVRRHC